MIFLDSVRNQDVWSKTKEAALAAGGFTIKLLADIAKTVLKKQIEDHTGYDL
jgi:hypothetical protein